MYLEERIERLEARVSALEPGGEPEPAPYPLAGLEYQGAVSQSPHWYCAKVYSKEQWLRDPDCFAFKFRDSTTKAPIPLWQVAKRLGVEHPVPDGVRWADVEYLDVGWPESGPWYRVTRPMLLAFGKGVLLPADRRFRLTPAFDHQEITPSQALEILDREDKPAELAEPQPAAVSPEAVLYREDVEWWGGIFWSKPDSSSQTWIESHFLSAVCRFRNRHTQHPITREQFIQAIRNSEEREAKAKSDSGAVARAWCDCTHCDCKNDAEPTPDFRVGDLVEVMKEPCENSQWRVGERFVVESNVRTSAPGLMDIRRNIIAADCVRFISRPNP